MMYEEKCQLDFNNPSASDIFLTGQQEEGKSYNYDLYEEGVQEKPYSKYKYLVILLGALTIEEAKEVEKRTNSGRMVSKFKLTLSILM